MSSIEKEIKVVIADDHPAYRLGLKKVIEKNKWINVVQECSDGRELLQYLQHYKVDIVLMDIEMSNIDGFQATYQIKINYPNTKVIAISMSKDEETIFEMMAKGAKGYLTKNADSNEIIEGILSVYTGQNYFCSLSKEVIEGFVKQGKFFPDSNSLPIITEKDMDIIKLLAKGKTSKEIADILDINPRTLEGLKQKIQDKFDVKNSIEVVTYALKHRYISLGDI